MLILAQPVKHQGYKIEIDLAAYEKICRVLATFEDDPTFYPKDTEREPGWNDTQDRPKHQILKIECAWEWRGRVLKCLRCKDDLYPWEIPWRRRYMSLSERYAFWGWRNKGRQDEHTAGAIKKVWNLMERAGVYWE